MKYDNIKCWDCCWVSVSCTSFHEWVGSVGVWSIIQPGSIPR